MMPIAGAALGGHAHLLDQLHGGDGACAIRVELAFQKAAAAYESRRGSIPAAQYAAINRALLRIEKRVDKSFTALSVWDQTIYPHQQVLSDVQGLDAAIADLQQASPNTSDAETALSNVALTAVGLVLDHSKYVIELRHHDPTYSRVTWGGQGHLVHYLDLMPQYNAIASGTWNSTTIAQLTSMRELDVRDLNARLRSMDATLKALTPQIKALR